MRSLVALTLLVVVSGCRTKSDSGPAPTAAASLSAAVPSATAPRSAKARLTPEQEKAALGTIVNDCLACHTEQMLAQQRLTEKQWAAVVKKMQGWGSQVEPSSVEPLVAYLSARYSTEAPPYNIPTVSAAAASEALSRQPDGPFGGGDPKKGEALYKEACAPCHGADARGTPTGMNLRDQPLLYRAAEFAGATQKGRGRMPAFPMYKEPEIGAVLGYLRALPL
jgi:cytochrome c2